MTLRTGFWLLLVATLGYAQWMKQAVWPLTTKTILAYEFARTPHCAGLLLDQLSRAGEIVLLKQSLYLDFGFLLLYGLALFVGGRFAARLAHRTAAPVRWVQVGNTLAWLGLVALLADAVENLALLKQFPPAHPSAGAAELAWLIALVKFGCILLSLLGTLSLFGYYSARRLVR